MIRPSVMLVVMLFGVGCGKHPPPEPSTPAVITLSQAQSDLLGAGVQPAIDTLMASGTFAPKRRSAHPAYPCLVRR